MSRRNLGRRYHRGDRPADGDSPECECGSSRLRADGTNAPACSRCMLLDGTTLSPVARALISELRQLGRATWAALELELPEYDRRSLYRALRQLDQVGRVRRMEIDATDAYQGVLMRRPGARTRGFDRRRVRSLSTVAAFELVEPK